jgi:cytochrome oxidase assembly protein ShyY1
VSGTIIRAGRLEIRFNWVVAACVLLTVSGLVRLGLWQLDRAGEKLAEQASYTESGQLQATPISAVPVAGRALDALQHQNRRVRLAGEYLNDRSIFLIYQTYEQQPGFEIVTPFRSADEDMIVLVSRGWSGINSYEELAATLPKITGPQVLEGQLYVPTATEAERANIAGNAERWPLLLRYLNSADISPHFQSPLFPYVVRLAPEQPGVLIRHWPQVLVASNRNFSYALQWFAMALAVLIVSLILSSNLLRLLRGTRDG